MEPTCSSAKRLFSCLASMPSWCVCCSLYTNSALRLFSCATAATAWQARVTISSLGSLSQPFTDSAACNQTTQLWKGKERKGKERKGKERKGRKRQGKAKPFGANVMRSQVFYRAAQRLTKLCLFQHQRPVLTRCNPVGLSVTYNSTKAVGVLVMCICTMTSRLARSDHKEEDGSLNLAGICRGLP